MRLVFDRTPLLQCLLCLYYAYCACTMPTMPVLCLLCLCYAYYACTMPTMPVLCLLCLFITTAKSNAEWENGAISISSLVSFRKNLKCLLHSNPNRYQEKKFIKQLKQSPRKDFSIKSIFCSKLERHGFL